MKRILVTGVGGSASNNFIRSLRLTNERIQIIGIDINPYYIHLSKADVNYISPPFTEEKKYIDFLNNLIRKERIEFLHCQPDPELYFLSTHRNQINTKMFLPSSPAIRLARNKLTLIFRLRNHNVPAPLSFHIDCSKDITKAITVFQAKGHTKFWVRSLKGAGSYAALPVINFCQAFNWIEYWNDMKGVKWGQFMISEFLPGKEYAFQSIWSDGKLITSMARERIAYLFGNRMPSGQSSSPTIAKTVHNDKVNDVAIRAVQVLDPLPNGIYCVDLKEDMNGIPCVTEINAGRFFTTSIFFSTAGCNMPYYYLKLAYGEETPVYLPTVNALPSDLYWIRQMDMDNKLVKGEDLCLTT